MIEDSAPNSAAGSRPGYTPVPTSATLKTGAIGQNAAHALEVLDHATPFGRRVAGHWLAQTHIRSDYVAVLDDVYDRLALDQQAEEQAVYGHLYRLALRDARNFCRVSRRDLSHRTNLSDRRLGKALAGLVAKKHIALVERDRMGTLYRVSLPHEVFGEATPGSVLSVRERNEATPVTRQNTVNATPTPPARSAPMRSNADASMPAATIADAPPDAQRAGSTSSVNPLSPKIEDATANLATAPSEIARIGGDNNTLLKSHSSSDPTPTVGQIAAKFVNESGGAFPRSEVVEEIFGRLEEGRTLKEISLELKAFAKHAPKKTPLRDLSRWLKTH